VATRKGENIFRCRNFLASQMFGEELVFDLDITECLLTKLFWEGFVRKFQDSFSSKEIIFLQKEIIFE